MHLQLCCRCCCWGGYAEEQPRHCVLLVMKALQGWSYLPLLLPPQLY
jgi:hypothetical protein